MVVPNITLLEMRKHQQRMALVHALCWENFPWYCQCSCLPFSWAHFTGVSRSSRGCSTYSYVFSLPFVPIAFCIDTDLPSVDFTTKPLLMPELPMKTLNDPWAPNVSSQQLKTCPSSKNVSSPWASAIRILNAHIISVFSRLINAFVWHTIKCFLKNVLLNFLLQIYGFLTVRTMLTSSHFAFLSFSNSEELESNWWVSVCSNYFSILNFRWFFFPNIM